VRFGVLLLPADPWPETAARVARLEAMGYDHLWTYDHLSWRRYRGQPWHAAIPWLTGVACATSRVEIGTLVASPNIRHPVTLAHEAVTLDHVSGGRFVLGVGSGGLGFDATVFGGAPLDRRELSDRLEEFVALLDRLFRDETVSYEGRYYSVHEACIRPASVRAPRVPLAIAAGGRRNLALVARYADAWITYGDTTQRDLTPSGTEAIVRAQIETLAAACGAIGRDPATIRRIYLIGNTEERPLASVAAFADFVGRYAELGFTDIVFHHPRPEDPVWNEPEAIVEAIATDVLPRWREARGRS
jgi:alkanesulfonate monooxygenase SsuD/methylene tetrahydromethanopterin reductase-like flavin-dependent oxidoreductase (luciferase family)